MRRKSSENEVIDLIKEHLNKVQNSLENMIFTIEKHLQGDMDSVEIFAAKTHEAESAADVLRRKISDLLHRGAFLPLFREDVMGMVTMIDKIAGHARSCTKFIENQRPEIPAILHEDFLKITRESVASLLPLQEGVNNLSKDFSITRGKIAEVDQIEGEVDHLEWDLSKRVFSTNIPLATKIHLKQLLDVIVGISDIAQDVSEILNTLIFKKNV